MEDAIITRLKNEWKRVEDAIELQDLQNIEAELENGNNLKKWNVVIWGRDNTPWEKGRLKGTLEFPIGYPTTSPRFIWQTLPEKEFYHINVWDTGATCIDILNSDKSYKPTISCFEILTAIENFLYTPNPNSPIPAKREMT